MKEHTEDWKQLCAHVAIEQDPQKLLELTKKINRIASKKAKASR